MELAVRLVAGEYDHHGADVELAGRRARTSRATDEALYPQRRVTGGLPVAEVEEGDGGGRPDVAVLDQVLGLIAGATLARSSWAAGNLEYRHTEIRVGFMQGLDAVGIIPIIRGVDECE